MSARMDRVLPLLYGIQKAHHIAAAYRPHGGMPSLSSSSRMRAVVRTS